MWPSAFPVVCPNGFKVQQNQLIVAEMRKINAKWQIQTSLCLRCNIPNSCTGCSKKIVPCLCGCCGGAVDSIIFVSDSYPSTGQAST